MLVNKDICCSFCNKSYSTQFNLNKHLRVVHKKSKFIKYTEDRKFMCVECNIYFAYNNGLRCHLEEKHDFENIIEKLRFENFTAFSQWFSEEQKTNRVQYVRVSGRKKCGIGKEKIYFECKHSYKNPNVLMGKRKRQLKALGSCKMEVSCASQVIVTRSVKSDKCFVIYYKSHYLHDTNSLGIPSTRLRKSPQKNLEEELEKSDLTPGRNNYISKSSRADWQDGCFHHDDALSVDIFVKKLTENNNNPIIFYKPQGTQSNNLESKDFCLIMMSVQQKDILKKYGNNVIIVDRTHSENAGDFELTTVLTIDEFDQWFPVAFMFSNRKDSFIYHIFFMKIMDNVGKICTSIFMSDIPNLYYKTWCRVMGAAKNKLLCSWHVDHVWQKNLTKIDNLEKRFEIYHSLKNIKALLNQENFEEKLQEFVQNLNEDEETEKFAQYFRNNFLQITNQWGHCYRDHKLHTNAVIESLHKTIAYQYVEGKQNKRLDKSIRQLMMFLKEKIVERIIKLKEGKTFQREILSNHRKALTLKLNVTQEDANTWTFLDGQNQHQLVTKKSCGSCCSLVCFFCNVCIHNYNCSCIEFLTNATICRHIHYIIMNSNDRYESCENNVEERTQNEELYFDDALNDDSVDEIKEEIKSNLFQVLEALETVNFSNDQLQLILQHTKDCLVLSTIK